MFLYCNWFLRIVYYVTNVWAFFLSQKSQKNSQFRRAIIFLTDKWQIEIKMIITPILLTNKMVLLILFEIHHLYKTIFQFSILKHLKVATAHSLWLTSLDKIKNNSVYEIKYFRTNCVQLKELIIYSPIYFSSIFCRK